MGHYAPELVSDELRVDSAGISHGRRSLPWPVIVRIGIRSAGWHEHLTEVDLTIGRIRDHLPSDFLDEREDEDEPLGKYVWSAGRITLRIESSRFDESEFRESVSRYAPHLL